MDMGPPADTLDSNLTGLSNSSYEGNEADSSRDTPENSLPDSMKTSWEKVEMAPLSDTNESGSTDSLKSRRENMVTGLPGETSDSSLTESIKRSWIKVDRGPSGEILDRSLSPRRRIESDFAESPKNSLEAMSTSPLRGAPGSSSEEPTTGKCMMAAATEPYSDSLPDSYVTNMETSISNMTNSYTESEREVESESELKPGDIVEFERNGGAYRHVGIAMGDGKGIIHKTSDVGTMMKRTISGQTSQISNVQIDTFNDVKGTDRAFRNNSRDKQLSHRQRHDVVEWAVAHVGQAKYNPSTDNCQHFANKARYNQSISDQTLVSAFENIITGEKYKEVQPKQSGE